MKNKPLKIIFDANPLSGKKSGVGYYVEGLVQSLSETGGSDIELVGHYFNFLGRKNVDHLPLAANIRYVESRLMPGKALSLCRRLGFQPPYELFTKTRADVMLFMNFVALPSLFKTKKVVFVHDLGFVDCPEFVQVKNRMFLKSWVPVSIKNSDLVVTISEFTKSRIRSKFHVSAKKLHVTPIPPVINPGPRAGSITRFQIPGKFILFVGTIEPRKNISTIVNAYEKLPLTLQTEYSLVLAGGKGWNDEEILEKITKAQDRGLHIILTGYVSEAEKTALYKQSALCLQPSLYEGFGMPILEAMSYGKAVICSDIEVFHEVAQNSALYFDPSSSESLKAAIEKVLSNPKLLSELEKAGISHINSYLGWDQVTADLWGKIKAL